MTVQEAYQRVKGDFPDVIVEDRGDQGLVVRGERLVEVASFLRDTPGLEFDYLSTVLGLDRQDRLEVVYLIYSMRYWAGPLILRVWAGREDPQVPSLVGVWPSANFQEREVYDLLGVRFVGHPHLKRLFLWEGFPGHPLRKDFQNRTFSFEELNRTNPEGVRYD